MRLTDHRLLHAHQHGSSPLRCPPINGHRGTQQVFICAALSAHIAQTSIHSLPLCASEFAYVHNDVHITPTTACVGIITQRLDVEHQPSAWWGLFDGPSDVGTGVCPFEPTQALLLHSCTARDHPLRETSQPEPNSHKHQRGT